MLNETFRSRWFAAALHLGAWGMLALLLFAFRGPTPPWQEAETGPAPVNLPIPVAKLEALFAPQNLLVAMPAPDQTSAFATRHFSPPVAPKLPPPTTRRVEVTYQGFYDSVVGARHVLVRCDERLVTVAIGQSLTTNLWVAGAVFRTLTLTNSAGLTNVVPLNTKQNLEVPLK